MNTAVTSPPSHQQNQQSRFSPRCSASEANVHQRRSRCIPRNEVRERERNRISRNSTPTVIAVKPVFRPPPYPPQTRCIPLPELHPQARENAAHGVSGQCFPTVDNCPSLSSRFAWPATARIVPVAQILPSLPAPERLAGLQDSAPHNVQAANQ